MAFGIETGNVNTFQLNGTSHSFSLTNTAGNLLIFTVSWATSAGRSMNTPTYNGVSLTHLDTQLEGTGSMSTSIWYLLNPATGSNTLSWTTNGPGTVGFAAAYCFTDADVGGTVFGTTAKTSDTNSKPSLSVSSASGEIVIDSCCINSRTFSSVGAGQTTLFMQTGTATNPRHATSYESGAGSVTMSWDTSSNGNWGMIGVSVKPTSGGGGGGSSPNFLTLLGAGA